MDNLEIVNIESLCNKFGEKLKVNPNAFRESMKLMGKEKYPDNTCNYLRFNYFGHNSDKLTARYDANFEVFEINNEAAHVLVLIVFNCGEDIHGNYSNEVLYRFNNIYEFHKVIDLSSELLNKEEK